MAGKNEFVDVRMRGFQERTDVDVLVSLIDARLASLPGEVVDLVAAKGRVMAEGVRSPVNVPAFDRSAMDGYAVRSAKTPGSFVLIGEVLPGKPFEGPIAPGETVAIMTGAPLPADCDCVVPVERATLTDQRIEVSASFAAGKHVGRRGEDVTEGEQILASGRVLRPQDLGLLASVGVVRMSVVRRPRVALLVTGNEVLPCGSQPQGHQIVDSNSIMLAALLERDGAQVLPVEYVTDQAERIRQAISTCDADLILVTGGSSVGREDHAPAIVAELGELLVHGINLRPAAPLGFGMVAGRPVFLLPGNPVSCLCAYDVVVGRAIRRLAGRPAGGCDRAARLPLAEPLASIAGRLDYVRVLVRDSRVHPLPPGAGSGASILSGTCRADGYVLIPKDQASLERGQVVEVVFYDRDAEPR